MSIVDVNLRSENSLYNNIIDTQLADNDWFN